MYSALPEIHLVRHGETAWSVAGRHTGRSDIPLTKKGEAAAGRIADRLGTRAFAAVWSSPSQRALTTCALAGFAAQSVIKADLAEWDYGAYEGMTTKEIVAQRPGWDIFRDGCPSGETAGDVGKRADDIIGQIHAADAAVLIFSSAHFLRVLAARWLGLPPEHGAHFVLDTASISRLGYDHNLEEPVIRGWNDHP